MAAPPVSKYYEIIARAVAGADSDESRRHIYERARKFQSAQLHKLDPPLTESEINRELAVLEQAIQTVEDQIGRSPQITRTVGRLISSSRKQSGSSKMQRVLMTLAFGVIVIQAAFLLWLLSVPMPSTTQLDVDLDQVRAELKNASNESEQYGPSALKIIIEARRQTLLNTEAMLLQKRASLLRRIGLDFEIEGARIRPASDSELKEIKMEIDQAEQKLAASAKNASQYSGGLVEAMAQMTVATDRVTIAELWLKFYSAKYGMPFFLLKSANAEKEPALVPGNVVKDRDAL